MPDNIVKILEDLTGQLRCFDRDVDGIVAALLARSGLGYSQLNELLLLLGYDRLSAPFFRALLTFADQREDAAFRTLPSLRVAVDQFRIKAILRFGNVKFAFKYMSKLDEEALSKELRIHDPIDISEFTSRHDALLPIDRITGDDTYYLGYLIKADLDRRYKANPSDETVRQELARRQRVVERGKRNHEAYLASDHLDVYVATSMRERHEYKFVSKTIEDVFGAERLRHMKLRWFDPTQAYCEDRIDKGLVEALMLRRAYCTLYLAQESDTLGKDSELASTLAQGKPVIAYVPKLQVGREEEYVTALLRMVGADDIDAVLGQLRVFNPDAAWRDNEVVQWVYNKSSSDIAGARTKLGNAIREHYDRRANTLKEAHPLGLQVNLETGVANGVLVARSPDECAELIHRILTNRLEFSIEEKLVAETRYLFLRERVSGSIFRVETGDAFLANAFWNFHFA